MHNILNHRNKQTIHIILNIIISLLCWSKKKYFWGFFRKVQNLLFCLFYYLDIMVFTLQCLCWHGDLIYWIKLGLGLLLFSLNFNIQSNCRIYSETTFYKKKMSDLVHLIKCQISMVTCWICKPNVNNTMSLHSEEWWY